jgi:hypothetical protein
MKRAQQGNETAVLAIGVTFRWVTVDKDIIFNTIAILLLHCTVAVVLFSVNNSSFKKK